ncbi:mechanosensitive ion channel family protein [Microcoleus sp. FACHB-68]|uniref:mechanosensitive ion channel family protein n=1 Tax=Microcoleus sp. FACHB-68 TaxID=2692826 RepID=UPI0016821005|nr:mechanosensitive ion channel family protein [Microcoleus sp. FACHB-68]MBD1936843.1 mechanosensitive ion channel family protein [Microcoleus sp. FACHB-68]
MTDLLRQINKSLLELFGQSIKILPGLLVALIILLITRYAANFTKRIVSATVHRAIKSPSLRLLLIQVSYVTTWVVGILVACVVAFPSLRLGDIIGLLGLSSVAFGFAFQDIFKNFLAGILLLLQEPFKIGDQIIVEGFEGTVEEISIRSTQIRTYQGERVVVPNASVFTNSVQVLTAFPHRRTDLAIGLDYNTPLPQAVETLLSTVKEVEGVLSKPPVEIDIVAFGESSIDFMVRYWTFPEKAQVRRTQTHVIIALKDACDRAEFNIPYPIRTVYHFDQQKYNDHYRVAGDGNGNERTTARP